MFQRASLKEDFKVLKNRVSKAPAVSPATDEVVLLCPFGALEFENSSLTKSITSGNFHCLLAVIMVSYVSEHVSAVSTFFCAYCYCLGC